MNDYKVVAHLSCGGMFIDFIAYWVRQWKQFENRSASGEVTDKSLLSCFLTNGVLLHKNFEVEFKAKVGNSWLLVFKRVKLKAAIKVRFQTITIIIIFPWRSRPAANTIRASHHCKRPVDYCCDGRTQTDTQIQTQTTAQYCFWEQSERRCGTNNSRQRSNSLTGFNFEKTHTLAPYRWAKICHRMPQNVVLSLPSPKTIAVSYTHLTLPTIYSV